MPEPSTIDWPEEVLGCPLRAAYRSEVTSRMAVIEVQDGPARYRLISDEEKLVVSVVFVFNAAQVAAFEDFVHTTLNAGSYWFNMRLLTGLGMIPHVCHISEMRRIAPQEQSVTLFRAEFDIEAYSSGWVAPPPLATLDPVDGRTPGNLPVNIYDGRNTVDPRPTDQVNSLTPLVYA